MRGQKVRRGRRWDSLGRGPMLRRRRERIRRLKGRGIRLDQHLVEIRQRERQLEMFRGRHMPTAVVQLQG
jgi:hypothetical protein